MKRWYSAELPKSRMLDAKKIAETTLAGTPFASTMSTTPAAITIGSTPACIQPRQVGLGSGTTEIGRVLKSLNCRCGRSSPVWLLTGLAYPKGSTIFAMRNLIYRLYEGRLARAVSGRETRNHLPKHVAVMLDGNRRWAKNRQLSKAAHGHEAGAQKIFEFLGWCDDLGIEVVTLYLLSTDNVKNRDSEELTDLLEIIGGLADNLSKRKMWQVRLMGVRNLLPPDLLHKLEAAEQATAGIEGTKVNLAVGYGGRNEISDAVAEILRERAAAGESLAEVAEEITPELISKHLYTGGMPDPDLIIRTSGEQRLSGFLLWQSASSELYFEEALWPDFRKVDFLRALRAFESRHRRFGA